MHVCDAKFCDFFIYSKKGQILTRIYYNEQYSQELITAATVLVFFKHKLGPFYFEHLHSAISLHSPLPTVNDNAANSANKDSDDNCKIAIIPPNQTLSAKPGEVFVSRVFKQHETQFTPTLSPPNVTPQQKRKRSRKRRVVKRTGPIYLCGECKKECEEEAFIKKMMSKVVYSLRNVIIGSTGGVCIIHSMVRPVGTVQNV